MIISLLIISVLIFGVFYIVSYIDDRAERKYSIEKDSLLGTLDTMRKQDEVSKTIRRIPIDDVVNKL